MHAVWICFLKFLIQDEMWITCFKVSEHLFSNSTALKWDLNPTHKLYDILYNFLNIFINTSTLWEAREVETCSTIWHYIPAKAELWLAVLCIPFTYRATTGCVDWSFGAKPCLHIQGRSGWCSSRHCILYNFRVDWVWNSSFTQMMTILFL